MVQSLEAEKEALQKMALEATQKVEAEKENVILAPPPSPANSAKSLRDRKYCPWTLCGIFSSAGEPETNRAF